MAKIMVVVGDGNFQVLSIEAEARGITIQELIRVVIIPDWSLDSSIPKPRPERSPIQVPPPRQCTGLDFPHHVTQVLEKRLTLRTYGRPHGLRIRLLDRFTCPLCRDSLPLAGGVLGFERCEFGVCLSRLGLVDYW